jgi:hypothetical protein
VSTATITIAVDADAAKAFAEAPAEERQQIELLLNLHLQDLILSPQRRLQRIMDEMGAEAARRGMTPDVLASILAEDG